MAIPTSVPKEKGSVESPADLAAESCAPIAIVGIGFRGPGKAKNVDRLWEMIMAGEEAWSPIPTTRWNNEAFYHPDNARHGTINVKGGHFLEDDVSAFDAPFFNMTGDEAAAMDPQQRLLLEVVYEGLENAGIPLTKITGTSTSCFVGSFSADYTDMLLRDPDCVPMYQCTNAGQSRAMAANRVSYFFDLKGPSVTVDTACSGSLVALHLACQSLQTGDASTAIAAGVNLILSHEFMSTMSMMKFLSPDGRCHTFDEKANGYARGEAVGCLILKPLAKALHDGNTIRAVIRGTGSNQDGRTAGIASPSQIAQENLIRSVYARTGLHPSETDFVEAHGTGTQAGDPLETAAISQVFGTGRPSDRPVRVGSIKTNVGHLEGASGVAGVIKAVLMLEHRMFLPNRNFQKVNPHINLEDWKLKIQLHPEPWETSRPRRVSVNSFGYGGTNAHAIIEGTCDFLSSVGLSDSKRTLAVDHGPTNEKAMSRVPGSPRLYLLSGFNETSCAQQAQNLREYVLGKRNESNDPRFLDNLALTLNERRTVFPWKISVMGGSFDDLATSLSQKIKAISAMKKPRIGFVFTGQGAQWAGMGQELLQAYPVFKHSIAAIDDHLNKIGSGFKVQDELTKSAEDSHLNHPSLSQTVCTALQIALVDLLDSWGIYPDSVVGHSSGEIAAAYASGALSRENAMSVAYYRGFLAGQLLDHPIKGTMMAVGMSAEDVQPYLDRFSSEELVVGCINSPSSATISGDKVAIQALMQMLKGQSVFTKRLEVGVAYHSPHMKRVAEQYRGLIEHIGKIEPIGTDETGSKHPGTKFFSSVSGESFSTEDLDHNYWVTNLTGQVRFAASLKALCFGTEDQRSPRAGINGTKRSKIAQKPSVDCLLEIGPHSALSGPIKQILRADTKLRSADISYTSMLIRNTNAVNTALGVAAMLASSNYPVNFKAINRPNYSTGEITPELLVDLPPYSWDHTRTYWAEPRLSRMYRNRPTPRLDLLGAPDNMACPFEPRWRNHLRTTELPWLLDHRIQGSIVFPAAGYLTMAIEAVKQLGRLVEGPSAYILREVEIKSALVLNETAPVELMLSLSKSSYSQDGLFDFHIYSIAGDDRWTEHCTGLVGRQKIFDAAKDTAEEADGFVMVPLKTEVHGISIIDPQSFYHKLEECGLEYGPCFSNLTQGQVTQDGECFSEITVPDTRSVMPESFQHELVVHPCTLDSIFHTILAALPPGLGVEEGPVIPVSIEEMIVSPSWNCLAGERMSVSTHVCPISGKDVSACILVMDSNEKKLETEPSLSIRGLRCARLHRSATASLTKETAPIYKIDWKADFNFLDNHSSSLLFGNSSSQEKFSAQKENEHHAANFIRAALEEIGLKEAMSLDTSHSRFRCYLQDVLERYERDESGSVSYLNGVEPTQMGRLSHAVGSSLTAIIRNKVDYSTIVDDEALLDEFWDMFAVDASYQAAANYLELIGHQKPDISILEFGVDAGQIAEMFLKTLVAPDGRSCCGRYTFAHESALLLEQSSRRLKPWSEWVDFKLINRDLNFPRGIEKDSFDVIILPHGLCTAWGEKDALSRIHDLLTPSGCLIVIKAFDPKENVLNSLLFGALHCLSAHEFCLSLGCWAASQWTEVLHAAHFTAVDIFAEQDSNKSHHFVVARKTIVESSTPEITIIPEPSTANLAQELVEHLKKTSLNVNVKDIRNVDPKDQICLILDNPKSSFLVRPDKVILNSIKAMFIHSAGVLWVTRGGTIEPVNPDAGLVCGFARTARSESGVKPIVTFDLDAQHPLSDSRSAELISDLLLARFMKGDKGFDTEYAERKRVILIPRIQDDIQAQKALHEPDNIKSVFRQPFWHSNQPLRLSGGVDGPGFVSDEDMSELPTDHVGIKVHAFGLTKWDSLRVSHYGASDDILGLQCSGVVYKVGTGVNDIAVGDRVACLGSGTARGFYHDRVSAFQKIRDDMTWDIASSMPLAYTTAFYVVNNVAHVGPSDSVLVFNAGGYFGQAVVDMCLLSEARTFAVVQSTHERDALVSRYGIPGEQIFQSGQSDIFKILLRQTNGKKVSAVIAIDATEEIEIRNYAATFGRVIHLRTGFLTAREACPQNMSISTLNIYELYRQRKDLLDTFWPKTAQLFLDHRLLGPASIDSYDVSSISKAIDAAFIHQHAVVYAKPDDIVEVTLPKKPLPLFRDDASYLLVGGLGGIGREIALWMARNGSKSLIFINRSGMTNKKSQDTVKELIESGVQVTIRTCDISNETSVIRILQDVSKCAPPIRGLIQAAMVLRDVHIENMQLDEYLEVMGPKYQGTWNLHRNLPANLDFFVLLSSISGIIGNATQSAYASGCAFLDSFAAYRRSLGLSAISIDLGVISDVGYLAENKFLAEKMKRQGFQGMDTTALLTLIRVAISQSANEVTQMVTGLGQWREGESLGSFDAPLFSHFRRKFASHGSIPLSNPLQALKTNLSAAKTVEQAATVVCEAIANKLASHLSIPIENIDPSNRVSEYGVDSHVAIELRDWISRSMMCTVPILEILAKSLTDLSQQIASEIYKDDGE